MHKPAPIRPELASVCIYLALKRSGRVVREVPRVGILAQLANGQGLQ
jgi:hypothetical protein